MSRLIEPRYISLLGQFTESFLEVLYVCALCDITINSKQPLNTLNGSLPIPTYVPARLLGNPNKFVVFLKFLVIFFVAVHFGFTCCI